MTHRETRVAMDNVALAVHDFAQPFSDDKDEDISWILGQLAAMRRGERGDQRVVIALEDIRDTVECIELLGL